MSMGKRARSTDVPARPPATKEVRKGVWRSSEVMVLICWVWEHPIEIYDRKG